MPVSVSFQVHGLQQTTRRLKSIFSEEVKVKAMQTACDYIRKKCEIEPGPSHQPVIWPSPKYRAWYFAARRAQGLPMKYTRETDPWSKQLLASWRTEVTENGMKGRIYNDRPYSEKVMGPGSQFAQHKATGWKTIEYIARHYWSWAGRKYAAVLKASIASTHGGVLFGVVTPGAL